MAFCLIVRGVLLTMMFALWSSSALATFNPYLASADDDNNDVSGHVSKSTSLHSRVQAKVSELSPIVVERIQNAREKAMHHMVVELSAGDLGRFAGKEKERYSVAAYDGIGLRPIPYQIDEYNVEGVPYFEHTHVAIVGEKGVFDGDDRLLFLFQDAGLKMSPAVVDQAADNLTGKILAEVKVSDATGDRYIYLLLDDAARSPLDYVRYDAETGKHETDYYSLSVNRDNLLEWTDFSYNSYNGPDKDSILDTLKLRISGRILANMASITLTNKNLKAKRLGYIDGPIRSVVQLRTTILLAKMPVMSIQLQIHHYPRRIDAVSRTKTPRVIPYLFKDPSMSLSIDAKNLKGSQLHAALLPDQPAKVDGFLSRDESYIIENGIDRDHNWLLLRTPNNFQILTSLEIHETDVALRKPTPISLLYQDDAKLKNKPERYVGQLPNFGYVVEKIPMESLYYMRVNIYFDDNKTLYDPVVYAEHLKTTPAVEVSELNIGLKDQGNRLTQKQQEPVVTFSKLAD